MTYLKSREESRGWTRERECVHIIYVDDDYCLRFFAESNETRSQDRARSREIHEGEGFQGQNMYKSLYIVEREE